MDNKRVRKRHGTVHKYKGTCSKAKKAKIEKDIIAVSPDVPSVYMDASTSSESTRKPNGDNQEQVHQDIDSSSVSDSSQTTPLSKSSKKVKIYSKKKQKKQKKRDSLCSPVLKNQKDFD